MSNAQYTTVAVKGVPASIQDLSRAHKLSLNMGELVPIFLEEVVPNDTFKVNSEIMIRLAPMLAPVMHKVNVYTYWFYVPNRLVWDNWNDHISGGEDGTANPPFPYIQMSQANAQAGYFNAGSLADYYGIPAYNNEPIAEAEFISALPFRGHALIYNEYFRDQDLQNKIVYGTGDGDSQADVAELLQLRKKAWEKDYFSSARPSAQKGATASIPLNTDIAYKTIATATATGNPGAMSVIQNDQIATNGISTGIDNLESVTGEVNITDLRASNKLQEWLELASRGGTRINELIRNFFGVTPDDLRLNRPQYLGSSSQPVVMSEVLNTAGGQDQATLQPLGEYGGHGVSVGASAGFKKRFKEHGYVHGLMCVLPKLEYVGQGLHRHWTKFDKYERYWPQFQNIGEQAIRNKEIFFDWDNTQANRNGEFGYAPRYSEYKSFAGGTTVHGEFKKVGSQDNLSYWHMARYFDAVPQLNSQFVTADPTERIFAVQDDNATDKLYCQIWHRVRAKRPMSKFSIPSLI